MKPGLLRIITHAAAILAGIAGAWLVSASRHPAAPDSPTSVQTKPAAAKNPTASTADPVDLASRIGQAATDFNSAWDETAKLPADQRDEVRRNLLRDWIAKDPSAALEAVANLDNVASSGLLDGFAELFDKNPEWFLNDLQNHRLGLRGVAVRDWWAARMAAMDPARLVRLAAGFGPLDAAALMTVAMAGGTTGQERLNAVFAALQEMPPGESTTRLWKAAGKGLSELGVDSLEGYYLDATHPDARIMFGQALAKALADKQIRPERCAEILSRTPAHLRTGLAMDLAREAGTNVRAVTAAIDAVLPTDTWTGHAKKLAVQLHNSRASGENATRLADWAATIPPRSDTEDLYRTAVRPYIQQQPADQIRTWVTSMPRGWRRDNTLAAVAQSAANFKRFDDARWALERIDSLHFQEEARKWISEAEKRGQ